MKFLILTLVSISMIASAQDRRGGRPGPGPGSHGGGGRDQVCFYEHAGFQGSSFCLSEGEQVYDLVRQYGMNDRISSIRFLGRSSITLYVDANMRGESLYIDSDVYTLDNMRRRGGGSWNDQVSSIVVGRGGHGGGGYQPPQQRGSVCFFEHSNYRGASFCIDEADRADSIRDLARTGGMNDQISSIRIYGRAQVTVYEHANMAGQRETFFQDVSDLARLRMRNGGSWNDVISSVSVRF